jgi:hypothetical protein
MTPTCVALYDRAPMCLYAKSRASMVGRVAIVQEVCMWWLHFRVNRN